MRLRLAPQNTSFFDLFATSAAHLVTGASLLAELIGGAACDREAVNARLRSAEHDADDSTHEIMQRLNSSFITPFDRQDIYALASALDDCMDHMEAAGDLVVLYEIDRLPAGVVGMIDVLQRQAELTADAMPRLRSMKELTDYWVEISHLEKQADRTYRALLAEMFGNSTDAVSLMKVKEVVDELESAADAFEAVAHVVETIAVKES